jgi:hypothetical protein
VGVFEWLSCFASQPRAETDSVCNGEEDENEVGEKDMANKLKDFASPEGQVSFSLFLSLGLRLYSTFVFKFRQLIIPLFF